MGDERSRDGGGDAALAPRPPRQGRRRGRRAHGARARRPPRRSAPRTQATIKVAVVTHGDTGSFWSVFKKGVDQAAKDLKARGVSVTQVYANNDVAKQVAGINAAIAAGAKVIATSVPDASALKGPLTQGLAEGHRDHHGQLGPRRLRLAAELHGPRRSDRGRRRPGRRQAVQVGRREEGADRHPRGEQLGPAAARRRREEGARLAAGSRC